jgi:DNA-binding MarR family transcriptional regulator
VTILFSPGTVDPAELDARTVGRRGLIERLTDRLVSAARDGSRPHTLLIGPRGSGKTHTLHVVLGHALADRAAAEHTLALTLPEDALAIGSYGDLLVELLRPHRANARQLRNDVIELERVILDIADGRMVLVTIENLDRVFDAIGESGQGSLRAWVETSAAIALFATAPALFPGVAARTHPWYGSFIVEELTDLDVDDGARIVARSSPDPAMAGYLESPAGMAALAAIRDFAGGTPRLWQILAESADVAALSALQPAKAILLDRLSPSYQQQLWLLPTGEQRLIVELARGSGPRTVTDLAAALGVTNQSAAAALGRLTAAHWVVAAKSDTGDRRATWYDLTDPLVRHIVQYRESAPPT